ncbi:MAG TPA: hypothetical protein VM577_04950 [Anaerovoracaceae bacterium]|nr:hypothetical protein [Anaerovoracaceae bacterium]
MTYISAIVAIYTALIAHQPNPAELSSHFASGDIAGAISIEAQAVTATAIDCLPIFKEVVSGLTQGMTNGITQVAAANTSTQ